MKPHTSAKASHYNQEAEHYDAFNEDNSRIINQALDKILAKHNVKTILDLTCGTGSQVFWLTKHGYEVIGSDINSRMITIARNKAKQERLNIQFFKGDMRTVQIGKFDAVLTIFNAVGHLTKADFEIALQNIKSNLQEDGIYIFDINNLKHLLYENNITKLTIDWQTTTCDAKARVIQYSTIDADGILTSYTILHEQKGSNKPKISKSSQTLQIYSAEQLKNILERNGFEVLNQYAIDGSKFDEVKSDRILTVAKKQRP